MKTNYFFKNILVSVALSSFLVGCGGNSGTSLNDDIEGSEEEQQVSATTITGKAIDGYLQYSTVCLDLNSDGYCQSTEPITQTKKDGSFKLIIAPEVKKLDTYEKAMLLVYGGKDTDSGMDFTGKLQATQDTVTINITPISTLISKAVQDEFKADKTLSKAQVDEILVQKKKQVADLFGLDVSDIDKDPIALKSTRPDLIKVSLQIQKSAEALIGGIDDDDKIEEVYEKLALKLDSVQKDDGVSGLFDEAYKGDDKLELAKTVSANIEKSLSKFDGDLEKVAFVTKQDLKKVKAGEEVVERTDSDELFQSEIEWDVVFIKDKLEDIGEENPSDELINTVKEKVGAGASFSEVSDFLVSDKAKEDDSLKEIYKKAKDEENRTEEEQDKKDAIKAQDSLGFKDGEHIYWIDVYNDYNSVDIEYGDLLFDKGTLTFKDYDFVDGKYVEDKTHGDDDLILKDGKWESNPQSGPISYIVNNDKSITSEDDNFKVTLLKVEDVNSVEFSSIDLKVDLPKGSKKYFMSFQKLQDEYELNDNSNMSISLKDNIQSSCDGGYFLDANKKTCTEDTKAGVTSDGKKWELKTVQGQEILIQDSDREDKKNILAVYDGKLWAGSMKLAGIKRVEVHYNDIAIEAIKSAIKESWDSEEFSTDNSKTNSSQGTQNSSNPNNNNGQNNDDFKDAKALDFPSDSMYWFEAYMEAQDSFAAEYGENVFADGKVTLDEYSFTDGTFTKNEDNYNDLILKNGTWTEDTSADDGELAYTTNSDKSLNFADIDMKVEFLGAKNITETYLQDIDLRIPLNGDAKKYALRFTQTADKYMLEDHVVFTGTLQDYIAAECSSTNSYLMSADNQTCDASTKNGKTINRQNWELKEVQGVDILVIDREDRTDKKRIYAENDGKVYEGDLKLKGREKVEINYNKVAIDQIITAVINNYENISHNNNQSSSDDTGNNQTIPANTDFEQTLFSKKIVFQNPNYITSIQFNEKTAEIKTADGITYSGDWIVDDYIDEKNPVYDNPVYNLEVYDDSKNITVSIKFYENMKDSIDNLHIEGLKIFDNKVQKVIKAMKDGKDITDTYNEPNTTTGAMGSSGAGE